MPATRWARRAGRVWTVLVGSRRSLKQSAMRSNRRIRRACSRSNRTPASDVISPPSKAANTTRLPKSEKRILKTPCFIKAPPNQHQYIDCKKRIGILPDPGEKCGIMGDAGWMFATDPRRSDQFPCNGRAVHRDSNSAPILRARDKLDQLTGPAPKPLRLRATC